MRRQIHATGVIARVGKGSNFNYQIVKIDIPGVESFSIALSHGRLIHWFPTTDETGLSYACQRLQPLAGGLEIPFSGNRVFFAVQPKGELFYLIDLKLTIHVQASHVAEISQDQDDTIEAEVITERSRADLPDLYFLAPASLAISGGY